MGRGRWKCYTASPEGFVSDEFRPSAKNERDRALGMGAKITRRDFLNGIALTAGAAIIPPEMWAAAAADLQSEAQDIPGYYPPTKTALRGSHPVPSETIPTLRD